MRSPHTVALAALLLAIGLFPASFAEVGEVDVRAVPRNTNLDEGESLEEEWVRQAILDLAYYLRSHKFNEFDRRYKKSGEPEFFGKFPDPPLRSLHWEVNKYCSLGLKECLQYSMEFTGQAKINRAIDTVYVMRERNWTLANKTNKKEIQASDRECKELYKLDWELAEPFLGPLTRFQWRVSVSYFMCIFTMQKLTPLSAFGEPCDNYANCLWDKNTISTGDPRGDDSIAFACAKYSFCPDPCCPLRHIKGAGECDYIEENPCPKLGIYGGTCVINGTANTDIHGLGQNHWNLSCFCHRRGHVWDSRFGECVDIDECEIGKDRCNNITEICLNTPGSYSCACAFGYMWMAGNRTCQPMTGLLKEFEKMNSIINVSESLTSNSSDFTIESSSPIFIKPKIILIMFKIILLLIVTK